MKTSHPRTLASVSIEEIGQEVNGVDRPQYYWHHEICSDVVYDAGDATTAAQVRCAGISKRSTKPHMLPASGLSSSSTHSNPWR